MADNLVSSLAVGVGPTFATDDDGTAHHPYTKLEWGANNTQTKVDIGAGAIPIQDGGNSITVDGTFYPATQPVSGTFFQATQPVSAVSLPLPSGAATLAGQTQPGVDIGDVTINNASGASAVNIQDGGNSLTVDGTFYQATQPVSAASLPLPTGAATLAGQTQPGVDIGDVTINNASGGSAVNIQDGGNSITVDGTLTANLGTVGGLLSESDFDAKAGSLTETAPATDTASSGLNGRLQRVAQRLTSLLAVHPAALGGTTAAASFPVVLSSDGPFSTQTGSVTETAPATDTASSGLNGRLQRIAQRITSLIALLPAALVSGRLDVNLGAAPAVVTMTHGKTIKTVSGSLTADTDVIALVAAKRLKIIAYSLTGSGVNANTVIFKSNGAAGTELWRLLMQSSASISAGANLSVAAPSFLFATVAGEKLTMDVNQTDPIHYSITYYDDDAA